MVVRTVNVKLINIQKGFPKRPYHIKEGRLDGDVARMGEISDARVVLVRKPRRRWEHKVDLEEIGWEGVDINLAQNWEHWRVSVNIMNIRIRLPTGSFSWRAVFCGI
jgi:hypothetical protein